MSMIQSVTRFISAQNLRLIPAYFFKSSRINYCTSSRTCWNCKAQSSKNSSSFFCSSCNSLLKVNQNTDYFSLLGIKKEHNLDSQSLTKNFRHIQGQLHPDKFSQKSETEQNFSLEWSSLINKAYKTLLTPLERGEYLLKLNGVHLPEDNSTLDKEFLMEMMEKNEEVEDAVTKEETQRIQSNLRDEINELSNAFAIQISAKDLDGAAKLMIKMKYLASIDNSLKEKLQMLMSN